MCRRECKLGATIGDVLIPHRGSNRRRRAARCPSSCPGQIQSAERSALIAPNGMGVTRPVGKRRAAASPSLHGKSGVSRAWNPRRKRGARTCAGLIGPTFRHEEHWGRLSALEDAPQPCGGKPPWQGLRATATDPDCTTRVEALPRPSGQKKTAAQRLRFWSNSSWLGQQAIRKRDGYQLARLSGFHQRQDPWCSGS